MSTQILLTLLSAIVGGFVVHLFTVQRDKSKKRRDNRISYLIQAYRRLEARAHRQSESGERALESAIADIQLFGTPTQINLAQEFSRSFASERVASLKSLLENLRTDLRKELSLEAVPEEIIHLRYYNEATSGMD